jgi:hypothetical protein
MQVVDTDICTDIMLKDSNVKETIQLCKYLSIVQGNQLQRIHTRKEHWYRNGAVEISW